MDNTSVDWERGFSAGVASQAAALSAAHRRITELENPDVVPRADMLRNEARANASHSKLITQADAIRRLVLKIKKLQR